MRVYLTGFMASGKSTVGPRAAARLGQPFLDLDRLIQAHEGRSISRIFAEEGEAAFRALESRALRRTTDTEDLVVALGGGALVDEENRTFAKEHGRVLYLKVDPETVLKRVGDEAGQRPLLQSEDGEPLPREEMETRIEQMMADREPSYTAAHATIDATRPVSDVVDAVVRDVQEAKKTTSEKA